MDVTGDILAKLEHYCAFQERCEADVRKKLVSLPISVGQRDEIVRRLKENDFFNDERFTECFIRGKMRENQWGKMKIKQALFAKGVEAQIINSKIADIDEDEYAQLLADVLDKWKRQNAADADNRSKIIRSLLTKGFEMDEILKAVAK